MKIKKQKIIELGKQRFKVINLTEPLSEDTEVFPGDPRLEKEIFYSFNKHKCQYHVYRLGDHNFHPHGDAPNHQNQEYNDRGFEFWGIDFVFNRACLIDLSNAKDAVQFDGIRCIRKITLQHLQPYFKQIERSSAVILRTGYDKWLESNREHIVANIPYLDESAVEFILKFRKLKVLGTDSLTIDKVGSNYAHRKLKDKFIVECLVNLCNIPKKNRYFFFLQTSPIAIVGATGGPVLAYAYVLMRKQVLR